MMRQAAEKRPSGAIRPAHSLYTEGTITLRFLGRGMFPLQGEGLNE
jgi:hypothetical protein